MKKMMIAAVMAFSSLAAFSQTSSNSHKVAVAPQIVEASCGKCNFGAKEEECSLYVRIDHKAYPVVGAKIDDFGDAHGSAGMCKAIRKAEVTGEIRDNKFYAKNFKLLHVDKH